MMDQLTGRAVLAALIFAGPAAMGSAPVELSINPAESQVLVLVGKTGLLSVAGHAHQVLAPAVSGHVTFTPADPERTSVSLEFDASALSVTGKDDRASDVPEVQRVMLSAAVLDVARYPTITFQSSHVSVIGQAASGATVLIEGNMTLHGTTRPIAVRAAVTLDAFGDVTARGSFTIRQTEFGMVPVTAAGGTIRVKDELDIQFVLKASPIHGTSATR